MSIPLVKQTDPSPFLVNQSSVYPSSTTRKVDAVSFNQGVFSVIQNGERIDVRSHNVNGLPPALTENKLSGFLDNGYLRISQMDNGEFVIRAFPRAQGGAPKQKPPENHSGAGIAIGTAGGMLAGAGIGFLAGGPAGAVLGGAYGVGIGAPTGGVVGSKIQKK